MLLDRIDIDAHGPLHHVELGPFAEHLNVITGPRGSGKTAITRFVRDSLVQRDYPQGMLSASCGRIVWADRNGLVHCRREQDGTVDGRRSVEFESRGDTLRHQEGHGQSWFGDLGTNTTSTSTASSRAIQALQLPESIVDGVITDTAITRVARVVSACVRAGLDSPETYQSLPQHAQTNYRSRDEYSPLADAASGWLVRLTGGRLRQIAWPYRMFRSDGRSHHRDSHQSTGVTIDSRGEHHCPAADRAIAVIAVRMAAGDLLARTGRHVPLVLETYGDLSRGNSPLASALRDYSRAGCQVVLFTRSQSLAGQLGRVGARLYQLHARPVVHAHRPLWKPHYEAEHYVGPHPHTYGRRGADEILDQDRHFHDVIAGPIRYGRAASAATGDVNRDFDVAWHEAYGTSQVYDRCPNVVSSSERTDWSGDGYGLRDGYYVANSFTTYEPVEQGCCNHTNAIGMEGQQACCNHQRAKTIAEPASPFFLSVDSPIDQAPSIDSVAAARLRGLKVTHINHLMQQDSNRLADAVGLASVDAPTIRHWQAECRLVCRVPQLRGFDARVLVGCGVTTPAQLAGIHPVDLLQQVEAFLASDRGQQILLSGSSHELSRITSWIAAANSSDNNGFDSDRYEYESDKVPVARRKNGRRALRSSNHDVGDPGMGSRSKSGRTVRKSRSARQQSERSGSDSKSESARRTPRASSRGERRSQDVVRYQRRSRDHEPQEGRSFERAERDRDNDGELKFYLQRENLVVDAPSIGARMAERLNAVEIHTVDDLLNADAESVASELDHRRVDADTVLQWQQQATLVCRVPNLRGHDAQLLVAAEVTTPEQLAVSDTDELFGIVDPIAQSSEGKRIIRGGKLPDREEVSSWICYGNQHREWMAA